jgi:serine/threonine protein kinase
MLAVDPSNRPTTVQVLHHPWSTAKNLADTRLNHENPALMKVKILPDWSEVSARVYEAEQVGAPPVPSAVFRGSIKF